jgi:predicted DsbA family dithiol-disulfide isomerase
MTLTIEMVSDLVCPWCWLGLRRLKGAIALVPDLEVEVRFRPYELDPTVPAEGVDYKEYMRQRFGSDTGKDKANSMRDALVAYGKEEGIPFAFDKITRRPNSFNAHRLVYWAQGQDKGMQAKEALFQAVFADGRDIGQHETLVDIAREIALDPAIVSDLLKTDANVDTVRGEQALFRDMGIAGVPTYIALRKIAVQGAESSEKLARFLKSAAQHMPTERPLAGSA